MFADWMWTSWEQAGLIAVSAVVMVAVIIVVIRLVGLRSLSKMSSFDFAVTVAIGSIIASAVATSTPVANGALAIALLLGVQAVVSFLRCRTSFERAVDNSPRLLMHDGEFLESSLAAARVTRGDVIAKLRESNLHQLSEVRAVVLETTGDVSVLHGSNEIDPELLHGVIGADLVEAHRRR